MITGLKRSSRISILDAQIFKRRTLNEAYKIGWAAGATFKWLPINDPKFIDEVFGGHVPTFTLKGVGWFSELRNKDSYLELFAKKKDYDDYLIVAPLAQDNLEEHLGDCQWVPIGECHLIKVMNDKEVEKINKLLE